MRNLFSGISHSKECCGRHSLTHYFLIFDFLELNAIQKIDFEALKSHNARSGISLRLTVLARIHVRPRLRPVLPGRDVLVVAVDAVGEDQVLDDDEPGQDEKHDEGRVHFHDGLGVESDVLQELGVDEKAVGQAVGVDPEGAVERHHDDGDQTVQDVGGRVDGGDVVAGVEGVREDHAWGKKKGGEIFRSGLNVTSRMNSSKSFKIV